MLKDLVAEYGPKKAQLGDLVHSVQQNTIQRQDTLGTGGGGGLKYSELGMYHFLASRQRQRGNVVELQRQEKI